MIPAIFSSKTPGIVLAEIEMMRSAYSGSYFLVEGVYDSKFWKRRVCQGEVALIDCEGRANLLQVAEKVCGNGVPGVLGIYDPDFDRHFGLHHHDTVLAITDENDLDVTLIASAALEHVLHEFADADKLKSFEINNGPVGKHICAVATKFGQLRYLNQVNSYKVDFDELSPYRFLDVDAWTLNLNDLYHQFCVKANITTEILLSEVARLDAKTDGWNFCQGHDCLKIAAQGMKKILGAKHYAEGDVAKLLRLAYSEAQLKASVMYMHLLKIQQLNGVKIIN